MILILKCFSDDDWIKGPAFNPQLGLQIHALQKGIICKYKYKYMRFSIRKFPKRYGKVRKIIQGKGSMYSLEFIMDVLKRTYSHYAWCFLELESAHPFICVFCESICISKTLSYVFVYFVRTSEQKYEYLMDLSVYLYSVFSRWICVFVFAFQMYLCICILYFISVSVYLYSVFHRCICVFVFKE